MTGNIRVNVLGVGVNATSMDAAVNRLLEARQNGESGYVCVTSVHGVMESQGDEHLRQIHNHSLMTVPDGMPLVWMGQEYGFVKMGRVYGPDLMLAVCEQTPALNQGSGVTGQGSEDSLSCEALAKREGQRTENRGQQSENGGSRSEGLISDRKCCTHFLYGATEETLRKLKANLEAKFPGIQIVGMVAPPFRPLTDEEEVDLQQKVAACKPDFFWVGLSTPKQEKFMAAHCPQGAECHEFQKSEDGSQRSASDLRSPISDLCKFPLEAGILIGVGAAFDIHAGNVKDSPKWIKNSGLQWLHRLCKEPRRLWRRYLWIVPGFIYLAALQLLGVRKYNLPNLSTRKEL